MAKQQPNNHTGWLLKFIGGLAYLFVVWQIWSNPPAWLVGGLSASLPALGLGIIAATAVISTVSYVVATFGSGLMTDKSDKDGSSRMMSMWTWRMGMWSAFTLFVLTLPGPWSWLVLIGFVLSLFGTALSKM